MHQLNVQWFPGHMTKAKRMIEESLKLVDVVIEMLDARIPYSSSNPLLLSTVGSKPKVIVLNKTDLADPAVTEQWLNFFLDKGLAVVDLDSVKGKGTKKLIELLKQAALPITNKWLARGVKNRSVRAMIVGIPNVGKSSLINRFAGGQAKAKTADKPGVTRGKQWLSVGNGLEILDTPGVLWPKFEDKSAAFALAATGAIKAEIFDLEEAVFLLVDFLAKEYPACLTSRYGIESPLPAEVAQIIAAIAQKRGCLRTGGLIDKKKVSQIIVKEFRAGLLGRISLDRPHSN